MPQFHYQALNAAGETQSGEISAESTQRALAELEQHGLHVVSIGVAAESIPDPTPPVQSPSYPEPELAAALEVPLRAVLCRAPVVLPALAAFTEELPRGKSRRQFEQVIGVLERGNVAEAKASFAEAPDDWIPLLRLATTKENLVPLLREYFREAQQSARFRREGRLMLAYPVWVVGLVLLVLCILSTTVVPTYESILDAFEVELPPVTTLVFQVSNYVTNGRLFVWLGGAVLAGLTLWLLSRRLPSSWRDGWSDRLSPSNWRAMPRARLSSRTADLLATGLNAADALQIAGASLGNSRMSRAATELAAHLRGEHAEHQPAWNLSLGSSLLQAVRAELPTPARVDLLRELSTSFIDQASWNRSWKRWFAAPVAICLVGLLVLITLVALFLPLAKLVQSLT
jgi:type II secretory pathway component PulF